eukprot:5329061-Heterocapsa_arctica.AAC.1
MIELRNVTHLKCVDQYDSVAIIRALRRARHFEKRVHAGLMVMPYFNYLNASLEVMVACCQHSIGATFNMFA